MIRTWASFAFLAILASACGSSSTTSKLDSRSAVGAAGTRCSAAVRGLETVPTESRLLIFGEPHGTQEIPRVVGGIICQLAQRRAPIVVGIEQPETDQPRIDAFVASSGRHADRAALLASTFWRREQQDGRSSVAMLALIEQVRTLRAAGNDVRIVAFDVSQERFEDPKVDRDAEMAKTILAMRTASPNALFVVLTGNLHAMTAPLDDGYLPMGVYLRRAVPTLTSLNAEGASGQGWMCTAAPKGCGPRDMRGNDRGTAPFVDLLGAKSDEGFDGALYVGRVTAAPPAVAATNARE
jgi:hypothetical protein